jgi:PAS domain S-box-containing protein
MMEDLEESKTYIENVIANFLDTLIVINIDRTIRTVNRVALGLLGYKQEGELVGRHIRIVFDEENILNIVFEKGEARNYELSYKTKDNCLIPMLFSGSLMQDKEGNSIGIVGIAKDISERKKMEETLRDYTKKTEEINKELDDFTYIISHDLKEPLRSIDAFSKFIADDYKDKLDEQGRFYIERVRMNASRMQKLIEDLLEISRIERKKNILEEVEVEELIEEVKLRIEVRIKEKNAQIVIQNKLPRVYCDRVRLTEVFANLISNAIKFNDKPMPLVEIGSSEKEGFYEFYVKDNGPGIEEQYFDKIFEIFQRLGKREDNEGTGAGLTIVKKIVQMHKGKIWLESKIGEGTKFYFTIPTREKMSSLCKRKIGEILVEKKLITEEEIKKALEEQEGAGI